MLNHFDLYDLTAVLINIRDDIKSNSNLIILESLIKVLNDIDNYADNQIRKKLATLNLGNDKWYFVYYDNVYAVSYTHLPIPMIHGADYCPSEAHRPAPSAS